ncbi:hypothetical protein K523DRAFT_358907 [Schizophyllum commune Tattone D]|nr:hypothetical protein K523DRAFT_358907 [Schizophyllum commune Tattone D]
MTYPWWKNSGTFGVGRGGPSNKGNAGSDKPVLPLHNESNPPSPLTPPGGETPYPGKTNLLKEAQKDNNKPPPPPKGATTGKGGKDDPQRPSSQDSSVPSSQAPSTTAGLATSKESSPKGATTSLLFQPPTTSAQASSSTVNLDSPFAPRTTAETRELMEKEAALEDIQNVDATFYARGWTQPVERDSLEKRVKLYTTRAELREVDLEDHGVPMDGSRLRFCVRKSLAIDLLDVMDEFESLLNRLRSLDPQHYQEPAFTS